MPTDERDPLECVSAAVETQEHVHRDGLLTCFVVRLRRADGEDVPICVETTDQAIELVNETNPAKIHLRVDDAEARRVLLDGLAAHVVVDEASARVLH